MRPRRAQATLALVALLASVGCDGGDRSPSETAPGSGGSTQDLDPTPDPGPVPEPVTPDDPAFFATSTVSQRVNLPLAARGSMLDARALAQQVEGYDPASLLRCELTGAAAYDAVVDDLGGVRWGHHIRALEDQSKPDIRAGFLMDQPLPSMAATGAPADADAVEIVLPDIVGVTESAALFHSRVHGLLLVDLTGASPAFRCASRLPGRVDQFFFHQGHLVVMAQSTSGSRSSLLHFQVSGTQLSFVEAVSLGRARILDSRRFNDKLVFYTDLQIGAAAPAPVTGQYSGASAGVANPDTQPWRPEHRALSVFRLGDRLERESYDTLIDTAASDDQRYREGVARDTPIDTLIAESARFGQAMWASDRYFVVTRQTTKTYLSGWSSYTYDVCTAHHYEESSYEHCSTNYETRPNPAYVPPDNSGGDRACQGVTLSDCLVAVARVSNPTIQVPVGQRCEQRTHSTFVCDARLSQTVEYPVFRSDVLTALLINEYTDTGFVRLASSVSEITTPGLELESADAVVPALTTSAETFDLSVPGAVQTLHFQNGMLYVVSQGVLQAYALGGSSLVRTAELSVVNDTLQSTLFESDRLYLSDFGWDYGSGDFSTLRVVSLANPAFPVIEASTHQLPGGHRSIIAADAGIFTIGAVSQFQGQSVSRIKLGLFSDPFADERAYLILAADWRWARLAPEEAQLFDRATQRALVPYIGHDADERSLTRIGISRVEADQIASEGAVALPELAERIRPMPGEAPSYLSFASSSIEWITPKDAEWQTTPVLEYFEPTAVYRLNEENDYVEIQKLGNRCRLLFSNQAEINRRPAENHSQPFDCFSDVVAAYDSTLLFSDTAVEFDPGSRELRLLEPREIDEIRALIAGRPICVLTTALLSPNSPVDHESLVAQELQGDPAAVSCMSPAEYLAQRSFLQNRPRQ